MQSKGTVLLGSSVFFPYDTEQLKRQLRREVFLNCLYRVHQKRLREIAFLILNSAVQIEGW